MLKRFLGKTVLAVSMAAAAAGAFAQSVSVGLSADVTSMDPHYHLLRPNTNISNHVFNRLVEFNDQLRMVPGLALSWKAVDDLTWEFKLRPNVTFHDGGSFTAEDVVFSIERVATIKDSPGPFTVYTKAITGMTVVDPLTIRFKTAIPTPLLPNGLTTISIVSRKAAANAATADFNSGKAAVGTGPYKFVNYVRGDRIELTRNEAYWGKKPQVQHLVFKILPNDAGRVAALLSNDVQVIEAVPVSDFKKLSANPDLSVIQRTSIRVIALNIDQGDQPKFVTDKDGKPLAANPFKDLRVRQALLKAIDKNAIKTHVMEGVSRPTSQFLIPGLPGYTEALKVDPVDVEGAKKLLAEAGYPNGFNLTIHGPNNRYVQDEQILQTLAQMFSKVGVATRVEAQPAAVYFPKKNKGDYAVGLTGWGPDTMEASSPLRAMVATQNKEKGLGTFNASSYSNPKVDQLIEKASSTINDAEREKLLQQATELAIADVAMIPLHNQVNLWATRKGVTYGGRGDECTYGFDFILQP